MMVTVLTELNREDEKGSNVYILFNNEQNKRRVMNTVIRASEMPCKLDNGK
jgi:hypothetical protein